MLYKAYIFLFITLFFLSVVVPKGADVLWINRNHSPALDLFFTSVTNFGDGLIFLSIAIIMLFVRLEYSVICFALCLGQAITVSLFKQVLYAGSPRPAKLLDADLLHFVPGVEVHNLNSFPSGHTTTAFCAALFLALATRNPFIGWMSFLLAIAVGYSRIFLLQHFLIDVAAGAVLGSCITITIWYFFNRTDKPSWMNSQLEIKFNRNKTSPHEMG